MLSFFREKSAISVFWLIFLTLGLHVPFIFHPSSVIIHQEDGFFYYLLQPLQQAGPLTLSCLYIIIVIFISLQINSIVNSLRLLPYANYIPAMCFVLLSALLPQFSNITTSLLGCFFICWVYYLFSRLYSTSSPGALAYNAGLLCGLSVLFCTSLFSIFIIAIISLIIVRPLRLKELFIMLAGIITPVYVFAGILFCTGNISYLNIYKSFFQPHIILFKKEDIWLFITIGFALLISLYGLLVMNNTISKAHMQTRKGWQLVFGFFIFLPAVIFLKQYSWPADLMLTVVPAALYVSAFFAGKQRVAANIVFWLLTGLALYNSWVTK